jgi:hypothetical protein
MDGICRYSDEDRLSRSSPTHGPLIMTSADTKV